MLAILNAALAMTAATPAHEPTARDVQDMASNYWVRQVGPSDDIREHATPSSRDVQDMASNYWVRQVGPSDEIDRCLAAMARLCQDAKHASSGACYTCLHEHTSELRPICQGTGSGETYCGKAAEPTSRDVQDMASNYWVRQVGPADDVAARPQRAHMSFAGMPLGMLSAAQYLEGGQKMAKFGYAQTFGNDTAGALAFVKSHSGWNFASWAAVEGCGRSPRCHSAFLSDAELIGHNATLLSVQAVLPGEETVRCHNHRGGIWCHEDVAEFNQGQFYVVEVAADDEPSLVRTGLVMCHEWPEQFKKALEGRDGTRCHTMPVGLVVPKKTPWCAKHDCRAAWTTEATSEVESKA